MLVPLGAQVCVAVTSAESSARSLRDSRELRIVFALDVGPAHNQWMFKNGESRLNF